MGKSRVGCAPRRVIPLATSLILRPFHSSLPPHRIKTFPFSLWSDTHTLAVVLTSRSEHLLPIALETNVRFINVGQIEAVWCDVETVFYNMKRNRKKKTEWVGARAQSTMAHWLAACASCCRQPILKLNTAFVTFIQMVGKLESFKWWEPPTAQV